ncbi:hypothetical protein FJTKL_06830 [Diaporthe vaccinii]|uniref:CASP-like protein n=1 Tax=Diaporthe vaccinii TaxID=105482 RepID=A0ABR4EVH9_9PEZI
MASNVTTSSAGSTNAYHFPSSMLPCSYSNGGKKDDKASVAISITHLTLHTTTQQHHQLFPPTPQTSSAFKMQFSAAILAVTAASVASAEAVFKVSDFSASCIPHSAQCV